MELKTEISKIHYSKEQKGFLIYALRACSVFYWLGSGLKNCLYELGVLKPKKVGAYVVSVGN